MMIISTDKYIHDKELDHYSIINQYQKNAPLLETFYATLIIASVKHNAKRFNFDPVNQVLLHGSPNENNFSTCFYSFTCKIFSGFTSLEFFRNQLC